MTRADVIEKLVKDGFVKREKKQMIPTEDGMNLIAELPNAQVMEKKKAAYSSNLTWNFPKCECQKIQFSKGIV